jgi:hypothetical protein
MCDLAPELLFARNRRIPMKCRAGIVAVFTLIALAAPGAYSSEQQKDQPKAEKKEMATSMAGCVDEQEGHYVLVDDRSLNRIADLEADGFPTEGFAKHVGHKVTVRGTSNVSGAKTLFKVKTVETISETCTHQ